MALVLADRVKVRSQTAGTGTFTLADTALGFQSFEAVGTGNETYYGIIDNAGNWEIGRGTYTKVLTVETLSRDTVISSSNNNAKINFPVGGKNVFGTFPSSLAQAIAGNASDSFKTIAVSGQSSVIAENATDTLTLVAGDNITITTDATTDTITINSAANSNTLVNGSKTVSLSADGNLTLPGDIRSESNINIDINLSDSTLRRWQFGEDGDLTLPNGGKFNNPYGDGAVNLSGNQDLYSALASYDTKSWAGVVDATYSVSDFGAAGGGFFIQTDVGVTNKTWAFRADGALSYPNAVVQRDTSNVTCAGNASTVVYTASGQYQHTIRLLIQAEGFEGASAQFDTQACEMIIAKSYRADAIAASVYGVVHTSVAPLATFTADWNALTSRVEVICTAPSANNVTVRIFATEIITSD